MSKLFLSFVFFLFSIGSFQNILAQSNSWWIDLGASPPALLRNQAINIEAEKAHYLKADLISLQRLTQMKADGDRFELILPNPEGEKWTFALHAYEMMEAGLQAKYPAIRTYQGIAKDHPSYRIHLTITKDAWFASVSNGVRQWYIDPYTRPYNGLYQVYDKSHCQEEQPLNCPVAHTPHKPTASLRATNEKIEGELRTYRFAVSASFAYTRFYGGTREGAMAGIVSTVNRVNMVYERDLAVRLVLVANNDSLIVLDPESELFTTNSLEGIENQSFTDGKIGSENYDIGHVFDVGSGGYADLGSACNDNLKARGYTGLQRPQGDAFDIDFVAHEVGHQVGANHTFNGLGGSCGSQRTLNTSFEPGSGTTIMSYAGICGLDNIAPNASDYFHGGSLDEMNRFLTFGLGRTCVQVVELQNQAPNITLEEDLLFIPILTPFELSAQVTDPDNDQLGFNWEQVDPGIGAQLGSYGNGDGPLFRSFPIVEVPYRSFPRMADLLDNNFQNTELLPNTSRELNFQLTVRDNHPGGGGVSWDQVKYFVDGQAGPFQLENIGNLIAGANVVFRWDVARTNIAPVGVDSVDLFLSTDGGSNFDQHLGRYLNDGFSVVFIPNQINTDSARFKLKAVDNIFFDISDANSSIKASTNNQAFIDLISERESYAFCATDSIRVPFYYNFFSPSDSIQIGVNANINGFNGLIDPVENNRFDLILTRGNSLSTGLYKVDLMINLGEEATDTLSFEVDLIGNDINLETRTSVPTADARDVSILADFSWEANPLADLYQLEISLDSLFENIILTSPFLAELQWNLPSLLDPETTYFWRVTSLNQRCGQRATSAIQRFTTETVVCKTYTATDLPVAFNSFPFIQSSLVVEDNAVLVDVNVFNVSGTYDRPGGIDVRLRSPEGPVLDLIPRQDDCGAGDRFRFSIDDDNSLDEVPCPNDTGASLQPEDPLRTFNGQNAAGRWTLSIFDNNGNGALENWTLELCFGASSIVNTTEAETKYLPQLEVFPNPIDDQVRFTSIKEEILAIYLFNARGQLVRSNLAIETQDQIIPVADLVEGIYFYQVTFKNGLQQTGKLVK